MDSKTSVLYTNISIGTIPTWDGDIASLPKCPKGKRGFKLSYNHYHMLPWQRFYIQKPMVENAFDGLIVQVYTDATCSPQIADKIRSAGFKCEQVTPPMPFIGMFEHMPRVLVVNYDGVGVKLVRLLREHLYSWYQ